MSPQTNPTRAEDPRRRSTSLRGQGNPSGALRAALTAAPAAASSVASAPRRFAMCLLTACAILVSATGISHAEQITQRLERTSIDVASPSPLGKLWSDEIKSAVDRQENVRKTVPSVPPLRTITGFTATLKADGRTIVVSTLDLRGSPSCEKPKDMPVGVTTDAIDCITRVSEQLPDGSLKPLYSGVVCSARLFDPRTAQAMTDRQTYTSVTYDTSAKTILLKGMQGNDNLCENTPIPLTGKQ